ncbi:MAG TPA: hypothetical protein VNR40_11970, partial [Steroidobacter sp.]|nr:hypothetical protein [Steroidobacter sp.]
MFNRDANVLNPQYRFSFSVVGELTRFLAVVDAVSGAVRLYELKFHNVHYTSCEDNIPPLPNTPPPATSCTPSYIITKGYAYPAQSGFCDESASYTSGYCTTIPPNTVREVMQDIRTHVPSAVATNAPGGPPCCNDVTDILVIQSSRANPSTSYTVNRTIVMPASESRSEEIVAHEMGHVLVNIYNNDALEVDSNVFAGSVREGMADTFAGILGAMSGRSVRYGPDKWTYGDGQSYSGTTRSAANGSYQYWQDITSQAGPHAGGQVIFRFFRRLQEITGISDQRL